MKVNNSVKIKRVQKNKIDREPSINSLSIAAAKLESCLKKREKDKNTSEEFTEWK